MAVDNISLTSTSGHDVSDVHQNPRERLNRLINEGKQVEATSKAVDITKRPDYFDENRFKRAQKACQKYYSNLSMASTTGLILLVQIESILIVLLKTGKSRTVPDLFDRYVMTAKYIRSCYETDFYQSTSEGGKYIKIVRSMHQRVHKMMNGNGPITDGDRMQASNHEQKSNESNKIQLTDDGIGTIWMNQYDMALTQFAFIGLFLLHPIKCAAYYVTKEELADITYYWRLISYHFGIEERFNLFVYDTDIDKQLQLMELVFDHMKDKLARPRREVGTEMAKGIMLAFEDLTTELSFNILDHWWSPTVSISGLDELSPYTLSDMWKLMSFYLVFGLLFRIETILGYLNDLYKRKFDKFCESGAKTKKKLLKKYHSLTYEL